MQPNPALHRISSTVSKVRATLQNSIIHSGSERVKGGLQLKALFVSYVSTFPVSEVLGTMSF